MNRLHHEDMRCIIAAIQLPHCEARGEWSDEELAVRNADRLLDYIEGVYPNTKPDPRPAPDAHEPGDFGTVPFETYQRDIDAMRRLVFNAEESASKAQAQAVEAHNGWNKANAKIEALKEDLTKAKTLLRDSLDLLESRQIEEKEIRKHLEPIAYAMGFSKIYEHSLGYLAQEIFPAITARLKSQGSN